LEEKGFKNLSDKEKLKKRNFSKTVRFGTKKIEEECHNVHDR
jgi:hypothetical protein